MISALTGDGVDDLQATGSAAHVPEGPWLYPEDQICRCAAAPARRRDHPREALSAAAPGTALPVDGRDRIWKERKDGSVRIEQTIYVERESQRKIVLGKGGADHQGDRRGGAHGASPRSSSSRCICSCSSRCARAGATIPERYREMGLEFPKEVAPVLGNRSHARSQRLRNRSRTWLLPGSCYVARQAAAAPTKAPSRPHSAWNGSTKASCSASSRHGETSVILEVMTRGHGRHLGLVRGGAARGCAPCCSRAIRVRADLAGAARRASRPSISVEGLDLRAGARFWPRRMPSTGSRISRRLCAAAAEREPHAADPCRARSDPRCARRCRAAVAPLVVRFELALLGELGFGLDLASCAVTGATRRSHLRVAAHRAAPSRAPPASRIATGCCAAGLPARTTARLLPTADAADGLRADRLLSSSAHAFAAARPGAAGRARPRFVAAVLFARAPNRATPLRAWMTKH